MRGRTDDNGGDWAYLEAHRNTLHLDPTRNRPCGDWQPLGPNLTGSDVGQTRLGNPVVATDRAPGDARTLWAGTRVGRVFVSKNADDSQSRNIRFSRIDTPSTPGRFVSGIAVFGATGDVYAATDFGVLRLPAGATHWETAGSGLPTAAVYGLTLWQSGNVLYAATHGRGAWKLTLP